MEKREKRVRLKTLDFSFRFKLFKAKQVLAAQGVTFSYDQQRPLIKDFDVIIRAQERICIVGKNGKGKTTLLKLLAGMLFPQSGEITYHSTVTKGFFNQSNVSGLVDTKSVEEEILGSHPDVERQQARNTCGAMMFEGDDALKKIGVLSGGEKSRVMLGKLIVTPVNLLILDEPTNHLDMESCDALLAAIDNFEGVVIMATHNEMFLHALADRLVVFQDDKIEVFDGSYQRFLDKGGWQDEESLKPAHKNNSKAESRTKLTRKESRRKRSEIITERGKVLKPLEEQIAKVENEIETFEKQLEELHMTMLEASQEQDGLRIVDLSQSIHNCQSAIDRRFDELETLASTLEEHRAEFEKKLHQLE